MKEPEFPIFQIGLLNLWTRAYREKAGAHYTQEVNSWYYWYAHIIVALYEGVPIVDHFVV